MAKDRSAYMREYQRQWIARRRAEFFTGKVCAKCGSANDLELDHINPESKVHHAIWSWSAQRRAVELEKCQVLCRLCHREKTFGKDLPKMWNYDPDKHDHHRYVKYGCRCRECKDDHARVNARYRQKKGM